MKTAGQLAIEPAFGRLVLRHGRGHQHPGKRRVGLRIIRLRIVGRGAERIFFFGRFHLRLAQQLQPGQHHLLLRQQHVDTVDQVVEHQAAVHAKGVDGRLFFRQLRLGLDKFLLGGPQIGAQPLDIVACCVRAYEIRH